jgi:hypothetical protein
VFQFNSNKPTVAKDFSINAANKCARVLAVIISFA